ncbi:MAG: hypothetical protein AAGJ51_11345 [Pseudomonadota bacterium]
MSGPDDFRPDLRGMARTPFQAQVQAERFSDPRKLDQAIEANKIERKAARVREKARSHFDKQRTTWVAKEFANQKRVDAAVIKHSLAQGPKAPAGISQQASRDQALLARAQALVDLRQQRRLHSIEKSSRRMVRSVMRSRGHHRKHSQ